MYCKVLKSSSEFLDFRLVLKILAFLFAALIFFVSFFYQEKKENKIWYQRVMALQLTHIFLNKL
jgi:hypothetical protein